jgi:Berberine and berberine like
MSHAEARACACRPIGQQHLCCANLAISDQKAIDDNYAPNRSRLMEIKKRYDPSNFFRLNANIRPAS